MTTKQLQRLVQSRLREREVRFTSGRQAVVAELSRAGGPRSAAELSDSLGDDVPLSSIYRTLAVLDDAGVVTPHLGAKGLTRFELAEWLTGHHHHLVCLNCGSVSDVALADETEARVVSLVGQISAAAGFGATDHALEIEGYCADCS